MQARSVNRSLAVALLAALALACTGTRTPGAGHRDDRSFVIIAVNDFYRIEGIDGGQTGGLARLRTLRAQLEREFPDLLVLHAGDLLYPSLPSRLYRGEQMIDTLNRLDGDARAFDSRLFLTFGNHEFDAGKLEDAGDLDRRIDDSQFRWLGSNIEFAVDEAGRPLVSAENLVRTSLVESGGVRVGLFSLTIDSSWPKYVSGFGNPQAVAATMTQALRARGAEVVVALSHLDMRQDKALLASLGAKGPDLVIGGHEHHRQVEEVGGRMVLKADADGRTVTVIRVRPTADGPPTIECVEPDGDRGPAPRCFHRALDAAVTPDADVTAAVTGWLDRFDAEFCRSRLDADAGCLKQVLGRAAVDLVGEELEIRRYETNLGNWVADQALAAFADRGAQVAVINGGALRLNQDIARGSPITRRHIEELVAYHTPLRLLRLDGSTLARAVAHSVKNWSGAGKWLQIAGLAFRHDPRTEVARDLTILGPDGPRPLRDDEEVLVVTSAYLAAGNDGYDMLGPARIVADDGPELKSVLIDALRAAGADGISPVVEGRICHPERTAIRCRAVSKK